jgi:hypothetical protein
MMDMPCSPRTSDGSSEAACVDGSRDGEHTGEVDVITTSVAAKRNWTFKGGGNEGCRARGMSGATCLWPPSGPRKKKAAAASAARAIPAARWKSQLSTSLQSPKDQVLSTTNADTSWLAENAALNHAALAADASLVVPAIVATATATPHAPPRNIHISWRPRAR